MLRLMMELRGKFPHKMLRRAAFRSQHFTDDFDFMNKEVDRVTVRAVVRVQPMPAQPTRELRSVLFPENVRLSERDAKLVLQLQDLLEKMMMLDPAKRI